MNLRGFGTGLSLFVVLAYANQTACSGAEFCEEGSYECSPSTPMGSAGIGGDDAGPTAAGAGPHESDGGAGTNGAAGRDGIGNGGSAGQSLGASGTGNSAGEAGSSPVLDGTCVPDFPLDGCTLTDATGIYVDPTSGNDAALGTRDAPLASAAKALQIASDLGKPVYLCNAEFDEHVEATNAAVSLRGGYTCSGDERGAWVYAAGTSATIRSSAAGVVLGVHDVTEFSVSDVAFYAADADAAGASSVAAFVTSSLGVTFTRVVLSAGRGSDGADAELVPFVFPDPESLNGNPWTTGPGAAKECQCPANDTTRGGAGASMTASGGDGEPDWGAGKGGSPGACAVARGERGGDAPTRPPGKGAEVIGRLLNDGWHPEAGADGAHGRPGQGGGGAASPAPNVGGGAGACGGCGGRGGPGGQGGGGSIALAALDSEIVLGASELTAANAGNGGDGDAGQPGQAGGAAGTAPVNSCLGGDGGKGAAGGAGGGGAGGVSGAILSLRSDVTSDSATRLDVGEAGDGGLGGVPGVNDGINGRAGDRLTLD